MDSKAKSFNERCYELLKQVPEGKVTTYREMAGALHTRAWRAVGSAMAKNEHLLDIPCHRVVRSDGSVGEYARGADTKAALLIKEGVAVTNGRVKDLGRYLHRFSG
jgi:methylated-DNA-[protein]-cysteine S-methyltransferase